MLPLNVPFLTDASYLEFLDNLGDKLYAVHFSLQDPLLCDARIHSQDVQEQTLIERLSALPGPKKYLLANGRFQMKETYSGETGLLNLVKRLEHLLGAGVLDGLIFADSYLLTALSDAAPEIAARLEAIPSVNFNIDCLGKLNTLLDLISTCGYCHPGKITLDRSLNRRRNDLDLLTDAIRDRWPKIKIELLANEGCLNHCPFRSTHEALISAINTAPRPSERFDAHRLNRDLACLRFLKQTPHHILASPFIRPEDVASYRGAADIIKVCGRTLGADFLMRAVTAYIRSSYDGNLFDLLDASNWMAEQWELNNASLPENFFTVLNDCRQDCSDCDFCIKLFRCLARSKPLQFMDLR